MYYVLRLMQCNIIFHDLSLMMVRNYFTMKFQNLVFCRSAKTNYSTRLHFERLSCSIKGQPNHSYHSECINIKSISF